MYQFKICAYKMNKQIQESFENIIKMNDPEKHLAKLSASIPTMSEDSVKETLRFIKQMIFSRHNSINSRL